MIIDLEKIQNDFNEVLQVDDALPDYIRCDYYRMNADAVMQWYKEFLTDMNKSAALAQDIYEQQMKKAIEIECYYHRLINFCNGVKT